MQEGTQKPHVMDLIARAKELYSQSPKPEHTLIIREALEQALADAAGLENSVLADTHALCALNLVCDYLNRWNGAGENHLTQADAAVQKAFKIDPDLPFAHYANGFIQRAKGNHQAAADAFAAMAAHNPRFARAYAQQANELINLGKFEEALPLIKKALRLGPEDLSLGMFYWIKGRALFYSGKYADAMRALERSVELRPNLWYNRLFLVSSYANAAADALKEFDAHFPGYSVERVKQNEEANPNNHPLVMAGRNKFHDGLLAAGMPAGPF